MALDLDRETMTTPRPNAVRRLPFDESMQLSRLPEGNGGNVRYMSRYPAWKSMLEYKGVDLVKRLSGPGTFGGVVYGQAPLAAARDIEHNEGPEDVAKGKLGIHSIQGTFTNPGLVERPFVFDISPIQTGRSFMTRIINARQPQQPSETPDGPFPLSDADTPLGDICFTCITTFKRGRSSPDDIQASISGQQLYSDILSKRAPNEWDPCPQIDLDIVREAFPIEGHGSFPILDMYKVDMAEFNEGKGLAERRELILYRPYQHIPKNDPNGHIVAHAFGADRNGLLMLSNQVGYGYRFGKAASLSYSFYVHVNAEEAVMDDEGWWLWEVQYPRVNAGRCMMLSRIWSPEGKHVASGYQDGLALPYEEGKGKSKL